MFVKLCNIDSTKMLFVVFISIILHNGWLDEPYNFLYERPLKLLVLSLWTITFDSAHFFNYTGISTESITVSKDEYWLMVLILYWILELQQRLLILGFRMTKNWYFYNFLSWKQSCILINHNLFSKNWWVFIVKIFEENQQSVLYHW